MKYFFYSSFQIFRGRDISLLYSQLKIFFQQVIVTKPRSSRNSSIEAFVVCKVFQPPEGYEPIMYNLLLDNTSKSYFENINNPVNQIIVSFIACGDLSGFDADRNYPLNVRTLKYSIKIKFKSWSSLEIATILKDISWFFPSNLNLNGIELTFSFFSFCRLRLDLLVTNIRNQLRNQSLHLIKKLVNLKKHVN